MNPYEVLGLTKGESDERTIKRAYAKLLKQHRPDQDPEWFMRLNQAYKLALARRDLATIRDQKTGHIESPALPLSPAAQSRPERVAEIEPAPVDGEWESTCVAFMATLESDLGAEREAGLGRAIIRLAGMLAAGRGDWQQARRLVVPVVNEQARRWGETSEPVIARLLQPYPHLIEKRLLFLLKNNRQQQALGLLVAWIDSLENRQSSADDERAVLLRVMSWCAFVDYPTATRLVALYSQIYGRQALAQCDLALTAGHEAKGFPPEVLPVLAQVIAGTDRTRSPAVRGMVAYVKALGRQHPVRRLLALHAPSLMGARGMTDGHAERDGNRTVMIGVLASLAIGAVYFASQAIFGGFSLHLVSGSIVAVWLIMALTKRLRGWWRQ